ncbi:MAG TPA: 2-hydroxyacyl-CoA dehydratase [Bacilli bacterium]|nr:2-hydroxyacyl-CoA dehydratase [Bacilli bacterium]
MANYYIPVKYFLNNILNCEIIDNIKITSKTLELGTRYSPDFVCMPFKYTLGSLIEALDKDAYILMQLGGGCRYGYYSEVQNEILKDLGYKFKMINLINAGKTDLKKIYKKLKSIDNINLFKTIYYFINARYIVKYMDNIDDYIRKNVGFEVNNNSFDNLNKEFLNEIVKYKNVFSIRKCYKKYLKLFKKIEINKPKNVLKVGIVGELYTLMEPFANYDIEKFLAKKSVEVTRFTNVEYLLFKKHKTIGKNIKKSKYIKYKMGADASDNICRVEKMCKDNYDGIIHIKSTFCTPEIATMPIINKICKDHKVPVIFMSFDSNTSEVFVKTRLEAFYDMLEMNK